MKVSQLVTPTPQSFGQLLREGKPELHLIHHVIDNSRKFLGITLGAKGLRERITDNFTLVLLIPQLIYPPVILKLVGNKHIK